MKKFEQTPYPAAEQSLCLKRLKQKSTEHFVRHLLVSALAVAWGEHPRAGLSVEEEEVCVFGEAAVTSVEMPVVLMVETVAAVTPEEVGAAAVVAALVVATVVRGTVAGTLSVVVAAEM